MADATLDSIDAAIMAALVPLVRTPSQTNGVIKHLDRWAGELTLEGIHALVLTQSPAVLVGLEREDNSSDDRSAKQVSGRREEVSRATFIVLVVAANVRQTVTPALKGTPGAFVGAAGVYALCTFVKACLTNLFIDGTHRGKPLRYVGMEPYFVEAGRVYSMAIRYTADYVETNALIPAGDEMPFDTFAANYNRVGEVDSDGTTPDPANPLQNPRVETDVPIPTE
jgi:hypothetical protein